MIEVARTLEELIAYGEDLAAQFEDDGDRRMFREPSTRSKLALAAMRRSYAERDLRLAVVEAKGEGMSWDQIGETLGVSGEAVRKRYSKAVGEERDASPKEGNVGLRPASVRSRATRPSKDLSGLLHRLDFTELGQVREVVIMLHHEAQGAETERFEEPEPTPRGRLTGSP